MEQRTTTQRQEEFYCERDIAFLANNWKINSGLRDSATKTTNNFGEEIWQDWNSRKSNGIEVDFLFNQGHVCIIQ
jgi:hypothetical protein